MLVLDDTSVASVPEVTPQQVTNAAPIVVVNNVQLPKTYTGKTSWKHYKQYLERISHVNNWHTKAEKVQRLFLALEGAAAEVLTYINETDSEALDRRFGQVDENKESMRRFDERKQAVGESIAELEVSLKNLHKEGWPNATAAQRDSDLKRKLEDAVSSADMSQYLRLHARDDNFAPTVNKARTFKTLLANKKSVKFLNSPETSAINTLQTDDVQVILDNIGAAGEKALAKQAAYGASQSQFYAGKGTSIPFPSPTPPQPPVDNRVRSPVRAQSTAGGINSYGNQVSGHIFRSVSPTQRASAPKKHKRDCLICGCIGCHSGFHEAQSFGFQPRAPQFNEYRPQQTQQTPRPTQQGNGPRGSWVGSRAPQTPPASTKSS